MPNEHKPVLLRYYGSPATFARAMKAVYASHGNLNAWFGAEMERLGAAPKKKSTKGKQTKVDEAAPAPEA